MPGIPIDQPLASPWISRTTDKMVAITQGGERTTDMEEIEHAVRFLGMLEIEMGTPDPEVKITRNGRVVCAWTNGNCKLIILICAPEDQPKDRRYECFARYVKRTGEFYEDTSVLCYPTHVRQALARLFPQLDARWALP